MSTPPHPDLGRLWELPIEEHLLELGTSDDLPNFSIALCTARYEDVAPKLLELLERAAGGETFDDDEGRMFFRGIHIIGGHRDPLAFKPLLRILRRAPHDVHGLLGYATCETLAQIVAGVFDGDIAALLDAIVDLNIEETARDSLLGAATFLTWEGRIPRQEFVEFLERFHIERLAAESDLAWFGWAHAITLLGLRDMWPAVLAAAKTYVLRLEPFELSYLEEQLATAEQEPQDIERFKEASLGYIDDVIVALQRCEVDPDAFSSDKYGDDDFDIDEDDDFGTPIVLRRTPVPGHVPAVNPLRGVGRNDPCPCGSGKKAKRCCLAA
jgi:hypothetical protein